MAHIKRFAGIPMSKCMREMCREEDYMFLQDPRDQGKTPEGTTLQDTEWQQKREERKKEEEWRSHVAKLASERESLRDRLHRLREFRDFQKKVLIQDLGLDPDSSNEKLTKILRRL
uniref:Uncharacterized protein n=1 Tax=Astyanax mexicanus TaxID=7994 RepID=A0A3B1IFL5_ASTMX